MFDKNKQLNPTVGIIIPIYNVELYLKQCLNSVIHQTYQNLQIILVDDGSTDQSFEIAYEYFQKDQRITIIQKPNGGLSQARNVGMDYLMSLTPPPTDYTVYTHSKPFVPDYIHFLDSDDWFELDCIEKCVRVALKSDAEIVWHSYKISDELKNRVISSTVFDEYQLRDGDILSGLEVFQKLKCDSFSWTWSGLICTKILKTLTFVDGIESEDAPFGMQLFALSSRIYIDISELMFYRIRPNSISQHTLGQKGDSQDHKISFPKHQKDLVDAFQNTYDVRHYSFAYSCAIICVEMDRFIQREALSNELKQRLIAMIEHRAIFAFGGCGFQKDPRNIRDICSHLTPYMKKVRIGSKIAYYYPRLYRLLKAIKRSIR